LGNVSGSLWTLTAAQLRERVASTDATPGGGSVSIVVAVLAIASIQKAVTVSLKKSAADLARHQNLSYLNSQASALLVSLSEFADADSLVFQRYLEAGLLPHATEIEKVVRLRAREAGLVRATEIPLEAATEMVRGLELGEAAAALVDHHVRSEALAGRVLLRASIKAMLFSVDANLGGISDETLHQALQMRRNELESFLAPTAGAIVSRS
jgi:formiminotetrahydrofolate cyclodeaminase